METQYWSLNDKNEEAVLAAAGALIRSGEVVAFPTETVYGLGANGLDGMAVKKIFAAKGRPSDNPLILHIADKQAILPLTAALPKQAQLLMERFWPGPLTLIVPKSTLIPDEVSAGLSTVAVRMPSHPVAARLIKQAGVPIAAPSANLSGKPSPTDGRSVLEDMQGRIAGVIDGGSSMVGVESTVVDVTGAVPVILRPGGITREELEQVLGRVELDPALTGGSVLKPRAPGMKYRHYAPQARMYVFTAAEKAALREIITRLAQRTALICDEDCASEFLPSAKLTVFNWGNSPRTLAAGLFGYLRECDRLQIEVIFAQAVPKDGLGLAVMNRMEKAAGGKCLSDYQE